MEILAAITKQFRLLTFSLKLVINFSFITTTEKASFTWFCGFYGFKSSRDLIEFFLFLIFLLQLLRKNSINLVKYWILSGFYWIYFIANSDCIQKTFSIDFMQIDMSANHSCASTTKELFICMQMLFNVYSISDRKRKRVMSIKW